MLPSRGSAIATRSPYCGRHVCESACGRHIVEESAVELPIISVIHREGNDLHSAGECEMLRQAILPPLCSATACYVCSRSVRA